MKITLLIVRTFATAAAVALIAAAFTRRADLSMQIVRAVCACVLLATAEIIRDVLLRVQITPPPKNDPAP